MIETQKTLESRFPRLPPVFSKGGIQSSWVIARVITKCFCVVWGTMNKLTDSDKNLCRTLGEDAAETTVDRFIEFHNQHGQLTSHELIDLIFSDWVGFLYEATDSLFAHGLIYKPSNCHGYVHEKLLAFTLFKEAYERKMTSLIKERHKLILNVPFQEKDAAKSLGAKWDTNKKKWYVPEGLDRAPFARWVAPPQPPGACARLRIDLVPNTAWFSNLRSELTGKEWEQVKTATYNQAQHRCEACGGRGCKRPVECHERWQYNLDTRVQTLIGTIALCPACHEATHYGLARVRGRDDKARQQLMKVNGWTDAQVHSHIREAMDEWKRRSNVQWTLDARWILDFVEISEATRKKILDHASGLGERSIKDWQTEVTVDRALQAGIGRPSK